LVRNLLSPVRILETVRPAHRNLWRVLTITGLNLSLLGLHGAAVADVPDGAAPLRIGGTENLGALTGPESQNDTARRWGIHGTDLGHMFWHRGKLHMVFGDTFGYPGLGGRNWRSNAMARIADPDPRNGLPIEAVVAGPRGRAKELIPSRKIDGDEKTVIPTYGIAVDGRMYLHYMSVRNWGEHGRWVVGHSGIAYSDDDGDTWQQPPEAVWPRGSGFEQVAFVMDEGLLYTFGISEGRWSNVRLRRVAPERILEPEAYQFWDGRDWVDEAAFAASVVPGPVGELSVAWSAPQRRWLMMYLNPERRAVVLRTAPRLGGPWSDELVVVTAAEFPGLYAPYMVPGAEIDGDVHYALSMWGPYNVFLLRTTLLWGDVAALPADGGLQAGATAARTGATPAGVSD